MKIWPVLVFFAFLMGYSVLIFGCSPSTELNITPALPPIPTLTDLPLESPSPPCTPYVCLTPVSLLPTSTPQIDICSPLQGITLQNLPETIFNPFRPPPLGSDGPHQGVDFSDIDSDTQIALEGRPVQAVLDGKVVTVIKDRFPYGNAIMIESPMKKFPDIWLRALSWPASDPIPSAQSKLTCPEIETLSSQPSDEKSIYLLYAHLKGPADIQPGDAVSCGQVIGQIGNSGNSLNPHLHLEARIGPAGSHFESMAHYDASASPNEMANYCLWRVSGQFSLIDPMNLLSDSP